MDPTPQRIRAAAVPLVVAAALFVAAGGFVHLREWLDTYRHVPADVPGAFLVRVGFPLDTAVSAGVAGALLAGAFGLRRPAPWFVLAAAAFQAASLAVLVATRTGSVLGWAEPVWTAGADQSRAVEIGALVSLAAVAAHRALRDRRKVVLVPLPVR